MSPPRGWGGTLPPISQIVAREKARRGGRLGSLYAATTLGGAAGILAVAFVLPRREGVRGTIPLVAAVDLAVALLGAELRRRPRPLP